MIDIPHSISVSVTTAASFLFSIILATDCRSEPLRGKVGSSSTHYSGWIDLQRLTDFHQGDKLKIILDRRIPNPAREIYVRLLPRDGNANDPDEEVGIYPVTSTEVEIVLDRNYTQIRQLSVHGGPNPFGQYQLPADNGPAKLRSVESTPANR